MLHTLQSFAVNDNTTESFHLRLCEASAREINNSESRWLLETTSTAGYKRGNAFGLDSRAWTYRERAGQLYDCASHDSQCFRYRGKKCPASELAARPIELSRGLVDRGLACTATAQQTVPFEREIGFFVAGRKSYSRSILTSHSLEFSTRGVATADWKSSGYHSRVISHIFVHTCKRLLIVLCAVELLLYSRVCMYVYFKVWPK